MGRPTACPASRPGTATTRLGGCAVTAATCRGAAATCADVGVAPCRVSAGGGFSGSLVGCCPTGPAGAKHLFDRLGIARRQRSAGGAAGAVMERARRGIFMGCA